MTSPFSTERSLAVFADHNAAIRPAQIVAYLIGLAVLRAVFALGILMQARGRWMPWLSGVPLLWSLIGLEAAVQLGIPEDLEMPVAGFTQAILLFADRVRSRAGPARGVPLLQQ